MEISVVTPQGELYSEEVDYVVDVLKGLFSQSIIIFFSTLPFS